MDSHLYGGCVVPPHYDSMVSKLIVHGRDREMCRQRLQRALGEYVIGGIETNLDLHRRIAADPELAAGQYALHWLERWVEAQDTGRHRSRRAAAEHPGPCR